MFVPKVSAEGKKVSADSVQCRSETIKRYVFLLHFSYLPKPHPDSLSQKPSTKNRLLPSLLLPDTAGAPPHCRRAATALHLLLVPHTAGIEAPPLPYRFGRILPQPRFDRKSSRPAPTSLPTPFSHLLKSFGMDSPLYSFF